MFSSTSSNKHLTSGDLLFMITHTINCALAHVTCEENLLVHQVQAADKPHVFHSEMLIDGTHPYLYENAAIANHVSGTTFIDAGRQLLKAISHLYYGIPIDCRFVLHGINIEFLRWAKLQVPIRIEVTFHMNELKQANARLHCSTELFYYQENHLISRATSSFTTFTKELEDKLMARQYAQKVGA